MLLTKLFQIPHNKLAEKIFYCQAFADGLLTFDPIEDSHITSQVQGSQHAVMLGGKLSVAGGLGTFTHMFVLGNFAQL